MMQSGHMVRFVNDHVTVPGQQVCDRAPAHETLGRADIDDSARTTLAGTDSADVPGVDVEEHRKLRDPLFEKRSQVHQLERVPLPFGNHAYGGHRLAHARRRDEHSDVMGPEFAHRGTLVRFQAIARYAHATGDLIAGWLRIPEQSDQSFRWKVITDSGAK